MNRSQFLNTVAERTKSHRRDVEHVWENALAVIQEAVRKGDAVSISGFGKFKQRVVKARPAGWGINPFTKERVKVAARPKSAKPAFTPAKQFKDVVAGAAKVMAPATKPKALAPEGGVKKVAAAKKAAPKKAAKKTARKPAAKKKAPARKKR